MPKRLLFLFPRVEVITDWRTKKGRNHAECYIFIANKVLVDLQWHMELTTYLVYDSDLDYENDEE